MNEVHEILKYKRPFDCWVCPDCDAENNMSIAECAVCGCRKSSSDTILKRRIEEGEGIKITPKKVTPPDSKPIKKKTDKGVYVTNDENKKIIWVIIIAIIIGLIIAVSQEWGYRYNVAQSEPIYEDFYEEITSIYEDVYEETTDMWMQ